jgi:hypothetical protein
VKTARIVVSAGLAALLPSCSIAYNNFQTDSSGVPEFLLETAVLTRYEDGKPSVRLEAGLFEQYQNDNAIYGSGTSFSVSSAEGEQTARGNCGLFSADTDTEIYTLFDSIRVESVRENFEIRASELKWSGDSGVLTSGQDTAVSIVRGKNAGDSGGGSNFSLSGTGFSANTRERTYRFSGAVTGTFVTGEDAPDDAAEKGGNSDMPDKGEE